MYANSWIRLICIRRLRRTSNKVREKVRLSLKIGGISGQTITTITDSEATKVFIVNTIRNEGILPRTVKLYGTILRNW